jgi:hypothetical protein
VPHKQRKFDVLNQRPSASTNYGFTQQSAPIAAHTTITQRRVPERLAADAYKQESRLEAYHARRFGPIALKFLQLPLGIVEGVAQGKKNILVSCTIDMEAVGMDLRTGHD